MVNFTRLLCCTLSLSHFIRVFSGLTTPFVLCTSPAGPLFLIRGSYRLCLPLPTHPCLPVNLSYLLLTCLEASEHSILGVAHRSA